MSMSLRSVQVNDEIGLVWSDKCVMKPSLGGLVILNTSLFLGVSASTASRVAVEIGVRMN